ncbi:hypothetical protein [Carboxylicivirga sp. N1Y90]|uniref:hypothetical protein n=1 Tax=Carboxylicivirga fragile TaxID=3417571 RepID=UPI003D35724C|nr:hypothetical protein [Marinilabiliaceae bacterium N1Y90]
MARKKKRKKKPYVAAKLDRKSLHIELKRKMRDFAKAANIVEAFKLIPTQEIDISLMLGMRPVAVLPKDGEEIPSYVLKILKRTVYVCLKNTYLYFGSEAHKVSLYDYFLVGEPLCYLLRTKGYSFKNQDKAAKAAQHFLDTTDNGKVPADKAIDLGFFISKQFHSPTFGYVLFSFGFDNPQSTFQSHRECFYITMIPAQSQKITINGHSRSVYRLGYPIGDKEVKWAYTLPDKLGIESAFVDLKIDIYIQKHALNRLHERLDCIEKYVALALLMNNVMTFDTTKNEHGQAFIQFKIKDMMVGYLPFQYIDGIVVITTFLLITNNGTPEGEKLHNTIGVDKLDKQYLGIDKLSTFIYSDLKDNEHTVDLFSQADCGHLFELPEEVFTKDHKEEALASEFCKYVELEEVVV